MVRGHEGERKGGKKRKEGRSAIGRKEGKREHRMYTKERKENMERNR